MTTELTYVFIACRGHSGSTLLEMLLGSHTDVLAVGEISHFSDYYEDPQQRCGCGSVLAECNFWNEVVNEINVGSDLPLNISLPTDGIRSNIMPSLYGGILIWFPSLFKLWSHIPNSLARKNLQFVNNHWRLILAASRISGCKVIVDASMSPSRIAELLLTIPKGVRLKIIHLVKDGRANMYSYMHNFGESPEKAAKGWQRINRNIEWALRNINKDDRYQAFYEKICENHSINLQNICNFIGIKYQPAMLKFRDKIQHGIGGNLMRFRKKEDYIYLDQKWKTNLTKKDIQVFNKFGKEMNKNFGYKDKFFFSRLTKNIVFY